jgi:hypothetical protein
LGNLEKCSSVTKQDVHNNKIVKDENKVIVSNLMQKSLLIVIHYLCKNILFLAKNIILFIKYNRYFKNPLQ